MSSSPQDRLMWYTPQCVTSQFVPACVMGGILYGVQDVMLGGARPSVEGFGRYAGILFCYGALQCPMEAVHGRRSLLHNAAAGGVLGYIGVARGYVGIPFIDYNFFYRYPNIRPPVAGAGVYAAMAFGFGAMGGKTM
eukprot:CAMPEP_0114524426 /NCGR_PEP_ID=MMETSP0109-20121206/21849_1 /TAXON_ID=29199 /ORGANISM="Chlorarachnion reptans, Strain CCCM449" /LENGTH=136 /DNA_ID=CAMNT_0001705869 /DNA_START=88 /DNA_END=498 /DNA_ORIENTATION=-